MLFNRGRVEFVLTGRFQTDPLEMRFSQYRGMSGGRFLVSSTEVLRSESIISYKILLKHDIDYINLIISSDEVEHQIEDFMENVTFENIDSIEISENTKHVVGYVSGYLTHRLLLRTSCQVCIYQLQNDLITDNEWINALNRGGLKLPSKLLHEYVKTAFYVLEYFGERILITKIPFKTLSMHLLSSINSDTFFFCDDHYQSSRNQVHSTIINQYLKGLSNELSEQKRKDQVESFKALKLKKVN